MWVYYRACVWLFIDRLSDLGAAQATGTKPEEWFADSVNTNYLKNPLRKMDNLKFEDWWFHGLRGATPNEAMELPAGSVRSEGNKLTFTNVLDNAQWPNHDRALV